MNGASKSLLSLSIIHYHPERDEAVLKKHATLKSGRKFVVSTEMNEGANVLLKKVSRPLMRILKTANSLGFGFVMFSPNGPVMDHVFPAFPDEWEDIDQQPREYEVIGDVAMEADTPEHAAEDFVGKVGDGEIVVTVRNVNTDSVTDVYLGDLDSTGPDTNTDQSDGTADQNGESEEA